MTVMMVTMAGMCFRLRCAYYCSAIFSFGFKFKCCMTYAVFLQFRTDFYFDLVRIRICYNVHSCVVALTIHTPNVDVVNILYTVNLSNVSFNFININA